MQILQIVSLLNAVCLTPDPNPEMEVRSAYCADLMSDVLKKNFYDGMLITGLSSIHSLRTAEVLGIPVLLYVRSKMPSEEIIAEASAEGIVLLSTQKSMYESCGILYRGGIAPTE